MICTRCWEDKPIDRFYARRRTCKDCQAEMRRIWNAANPEKSQLAHRIQKLKRYGLTLDDYDRMVTEQKGCCAICLGEGVLDPGSLMRLGVDHDHETGRVRGLLCRPCNRAVGILGDDPSTFERAATYLRNSNHNKAGLRKARCDSSSR